MGLTVDVSSVVVSTRPTSSLPVFEPSGQRGFWSGLGHSLLTGCESLINNLFICLCDKGRLK